MITISHEDYRKRVQGCWLGKAVGGTLGMPHEGKMGPLDLTFYDPVPKGVIPNDDLDLQVLWAEIIERVGPFISRHDLGRAWIEHTDFPWDEYGVASANLGRGILPPASGHHINFCGDCMGSPIRSEIWAVLAPGDPELACKLAYEDAVIDHDGEGIWGELFFAAIESAAFVIQDRDKLIDIGLSAIPAYCRVAKAIRSTLKWFAETNDWRKTRENIMAEYSRENFTDAPQNLAFVILGWLAGKDFGEAICIAVNCGQDTDCTGATLGAILGIIDPACISEKWKKPISEALALSGGMKNMNPPKTIIGFSEQTIRLAETMIRTRSENVRFGKKTTNVPQTFSLKPFMQDMPADSILLSDGTMRISAIYPKGLTFIPGEKFAVTVKFENRSNKKTEFDLDILLPTDWKVTNGKKGKSERIILKKNETKEIPFILSAPEHLRMYYEYTTLRIERSRVRAEYRLPMISAWQWTMNVNGKEETIWLPERMILPCNSKTLAMKNAGDKLSGKTKFHLPRHQKVRFVLASNGSGSLKIDGKEIIKYTDAKFFPMTHRYWPNTNNEIELNAGLHTIEFSLKFKTDAPQAALLIADAYNCLIISDLTLATDLTA